MQNYNMISKTEQRLRSQKVFSERVFALHILTQKKTSHVLWGVLTLSRLLKSCALSKRLRPKKSLLWLASDVTHFVPHLMHAESNVFTQYTSRNKRTADLSLNLYSFFSTLKTIERWRLFTRRERVKTNHFSTPVDTILRFFHSEVTWLSAREQSPCKAVTCWTDWH